MSRIEVQKTLSKTLFLIDGHLLCSYKLDKSIYDNINVTIQDSGGVFLRDCNSILLRKSDFGKVKPNVIKKFIVFHVGNKLGNRVYDEMVQDFGLFCKLKEKVMFT